MDKSKALQNKIQTAINDQKEWLPEINTYIDFMKGKQYAAKPKRDEVTFNIIHTTLQAILRSVITGKPHMYVEPDSSDAIEPAPLLEKAINDWWLRLKIKSQIELSVLDYAALGLGVTYTDWDFRVDVNQKIINDTPMVLNIPYRDFLIDPEATTQEIYEAKYMIRKYIRPTKELKGDPRYSKTKNLKGDVSFKTETDSKDTESVERTTLYQIWIPEDKCSYILHEDSPDIMREVPNKFGREYPFTLLQNYKMPGELRPFGEVKILFESQKILNKLFTLVMTHAKRVSNRQYTANDMISDTELRKLRDAEDGEVLKVQGNARPGEVISPLMDLQLSADVYRAFELINATIVQLSSISEYRRSAMPKTERKATEAAYVEQASELSTNAKAEDVAEHSEEIARKLFQLISHESNIETQEVTYKDETSGNWTSQAYNGASFPGTYRFRWESGIAAPINAQSRVQKLTSYVSALAALIGQAPQLASTINFTELMKSMGDAFDIKNKESIMTPDPKAIGQGMSGDMPGQGGAPGIANSIAARMTGGR